MRRYSVARSITSSGVSMNSRIGLASMLPMNRSAIPLMSATSATVCIAFLMPVLFFCPM